MTENDANRALFCYFNSSIRTAEVLEEFEDNLYERIVDTHGYLLELRDQGRSVLCRGYVVIEPSSEKECNGSMTFTCYKSSSGRRAILDFIKSEVSIDICEKHEGSKEIYYFNRTYRLKGQTSCDREGFGPYKRYGEEYSGYYINGIIIDISSLLLRTRSDFVMT